MLRQTVADRAGDRDRVREAGHGGDGARPPRRAVHDRGVKLHYPEQVGQPADAHIVVRFVGLDDPDGGLRRVHRAGPGPQQPHSCLEPDLAALTGHDDWSGHG